MHKIQENCAYSLIVTLLIAANCVIAKAAIDVKRNAAATSLEANSNIPSIEDDYSEDEEMPSQESVQLLSTLSPYFEKNNKTVYIKELGQSLTLDCPVKNLDERQQILWYKEANNIALGKTTLSDAYEVNSSNYRLTVKNYTDKVDVRNFYCEVIPQKIRFHIMVKVGEGGPDVLTPPPEQIQASEMPKNTASMQFEGKHVYIVCLLLTAIQAISQAV